MRILVLMLAGLVLASCANVIPGSGYAEPGFAAYCAAHTGEGTCP